MADPPATLASLRAALDTGEASSAELVERSLADAAATEAGLHAFVGLRAAHARAEAAAADARREGG